MLFFEEQANEETTLRYYEAVLTTCRVLAQQPFGGKHFPRPLPRSLDARLGMLFISHDLRTVASGRRIGAGVSGYE